MIRCKLYMHQNMRNMLRLSVPDPLGSDHWAGHRSIRRLHVSSHLTSSVLQVNVFYTSVTT